MYRAVKIRLYPDEVQAIQINKLLGCCRVVYNQCLARKIKSYKEDKVVENLSTLGKFIHGELLKSEEFSWLRENNTKVYGEELRNMLTAYDNFFKFHKGFPKFKSKYDHNQSCTFPSQAISKRNIYTSFHLSLANIKNIKFRCDKDDTYYLQRNKENIKSATLRKLPSGEYYLSILIDGELRRKVNETEKTVGIDLGVKDFIVTSDGDKFESPNFKKSFQKKIKKLQKRLSKKEKGSKNFEKARLKLAKTYKKINDKKEYYLHEVSNSLIDNNQIICMEDLNVKGMVKNHNLAESISEMNFGDFRRKLEYKADWYNRKIVKVDRFYPSSKTCHHCGYVNKELKLSDRKWVCPQCGEVIDRDYNAALNILDEGLRLMENQ